MSFTFFDADKKELGEIGTSTWMEIRKLVADGIYPAMETLIQHGMTNELRGISRECRALISKTTDAETTAQLDNIAEMAKRADEVIIIALSW